MDLHTFINLFVAYLGRLYKGAILKQATTARFLCLDNILCHTALFFFWGRSTLQKTQLYVNQWEENHTKTQTLVKDPHWIALFYVWQCFWHNRKRIIHPKITFNSPQQFWYSDTQHASFAIVPSIIIHSNQL